MKNFIATLGLFGALLFPTYSFAAECTTPDTVMEAAGKSSGIYVSIPKEILQNYVAAIEDAGFTTGIPEGFEYTDGAIIVNSQSAFVVFYQNGCFAGMLTVPLPLHYQIMREAFN